MSATNSAQERKVDLIRRLNTSIQVLNERKSALQSKLESETLNDAQKNNINKEINDIDSSIASAKDQITEELGGDINFEQTIFKLPVYYYLGSVLEAIGESVGTRIGQRKRIINYSYIPLKTKAGEPFKWRLASSLSDETLIAFNDNISTKDVLETEITINTVYEVPIPKEKVDSLLSDNSLEEMNIMELIQELLELVVEVVPALKLVATYDRSGNVITIFQHSRMDDIEKIAINAESQLLNDDPREKTSFEINYGTPNSLVENLNVAAGIDPAFASIFRDPNQGDVFGASYYKTIKDDAELRREFIQLVGSSKAESGRQRGVLRSSISLPFSDEIQKISIQGESAEDVSEAINDILSYEPSGQNGVDYTPVINDFLSSYINSALSSEFRESVVAKFIKDNKSIAQNLLSSYLLNCDVTIHGTVGLGGFDHAIMTDYIPTIGGLYIMNSVEDIITPAGFSTVINMALIKELSLIRDLNKNN